jgi:hypothetical protein
MRSTRPWLSAPACCALLALAGCNGEVASNSPDEGDGGAAGSGHDADHGGSHASGGSGGSAGTVAHSSAGTSAGTSGHAGSSAAGHPADSAGSRAEQDAGAGEGGGGGAAGSPVQSIPVGVACKVAPQTAPPAAWSNATGNLAGLASECGNLTLVAADPCHDRVIAGVAHGGLWMTMDRGASWMKLGTGAGSAELVHRPSSIVFDPEHSDVFYESGIYGALNDGVFKSEDGGTTLKPLGTIGHIDLVSVDFSDPDRKTLLAGAHETKQKLFLSTDAGQSWTDIGPNLPAGSHFSSAPLVLDAQHFLLGACGWGDGTCGVFASADQGKHWDMTSMESPAGRPLWAKDGHMVWPAIWGSGALLSDDSGAHWTKVSGPHAGAPEELPDGRIISIGGDHLIISSDHGATWTNIGEPLPYQPAGMTYSPTTKSVFIWHNDCMDKVLPDAVMTAGFDGG